MPAKTRAKIVIADDEPDVLESTAMLVRSMGLQAITVEHAHAIADTIGREQPVLVLQDLRMPGLNIAALIAELRGRADTKDVPLVFFSANADLPTVAAEYDVWGYIAKPFNPDELTHLCQQVLAAATRNPPALQDQEFHRGIEAVFHDYWNLLSAQANYLEVLVQAKQLPPEQARAVMGLAETLLKIESRTDHLRTYILSLAGSSEGKQLTRSTPAKP